MGTMAAGEDTTREKFRQMTNESIRPLILFLAAPSILSQLVRSIYIT